MKSGSQVPDRRSHFAFFVSDVDNVTWCRRAPSGAQQTQRCHGERDDVMLLRLHDEQQLAISWNQRKRHLHKKLSYRRETARRAMSIEMLSTAAQLYEKKIKSYLQSLENDLKIIEIIAIYIL